MKKLLCILLVLVMLMSISAVSFSASETTDTEKEQIIYFEVPDTWRNFKRIFCHIWPYGSDPLGNWQSKREVCDETDTKNLFSYDISKVGILEDDIFYCVIFSNDAGMQLYETYLTTDCFGKTLVATDEYARYNDSMPYQVAIWKDVNDSQLNGIPVSIDYKGFISGNTLPDYINPEEVFRNFLINDLNIARMFTDKTDHQLIFSYMYALSLNLGDTISIIEETGTDVTFNGVDYGKGSPRECPVYYRGDVDLDGVISIKDATTLQKSIAEIIILNRVQKVCANANDTNIVNINDVTAIQKYLAGLDYLDVINKPFSSSDFVY